MEFHELGYKVTVKSVFADPADSYGSHADRLAFSVDFYPNVGSVISTFVYLPAQKYTAVDLQEKLPPVIRECIKRLDSENHQRDVADAEKRAKKRALDLIVDYTKDVMKELP